MTDTEVEAVARAHEECWQCGGTGLVAGCFESCCSGEDCDPEDPENCCSPSRCDVCRPAALDQARAKER